MPRIDYDSHHPGRIPSETVVHRDPLDRTTVVQVSGELDLAAIGRVEAALCEAVQRPGERLLVDLCDCRFIDAPAIDSVRRARRALDRDADTGPPMVLVADRPGLLRLLGEAGLDRLIPIVGDRHRALDLLLRFS
jgi:anti-anti-sigma factor